MNQVQKKIILEGINQRKSTTAILKTLHKHRIGVDSYWIRCKLAYVFMMAGLHDGYKRFRYVDGLRKLKQNKQIINENYQLVRISNERL